MLFFPTIGIWGRKSLITKVVLTHREIDPLAIAISIIDARLVVACDVDMTQTTWELRTE